MRVGIYHGAGASSRFVDALVKAFAPHPVALLNARALLFADWPAHVDVLAVPGGRDLPYVRDLHGKGTRRIRAFVEGGGRYLGICAGAYFGSREVVFESGGPLQVLGQRELSFYAGKAVGPAYGLGLFDYRSERGARLAQVGSARVYFNGGPAFPEAKGGEVLARYDDLPDKPAAILRCPVGSGVAILAGVHIECPVPDDAARRALWDQTLDALFLTESTVRTI